MAYPGQALAQSKAPIELNWNALESCPSADTVLARVHKIAGTTRATPNTLRADATITQPNEGLFRLRLEIRYGNLAAVRDIEGKSCKDLAGAAAVALALLLSSAEPLTENDLSGTPPATSTTGAAAGGDQEPNKQASPNEPAKTPGASEQKPAIPPSAETGPSRRWRLLLVAPLGVLSVGPLQQISRGLGLAGGISFDRWRFFVEGKFWASQRETVAHMSGEYAVDLDRFAVNARGCRSVLGSNFEFAPCMLMSVHHLSAPGSGPNLVPGTDTATWASVGIGAQARLLITPWLGLVAGVDGELQLSRPEISISLPPAGSAVPSEILVERLAPVAATISLGSQWIF